jgi:hypothetical protein
MDVAVLVRLMSEADLPWLRMVTAKRYPRDKFDPESMEGWFVNIVLKQPLLFCPIRTDNAFVISMLCCVPWLPAEFEANVVAVCADDGGMWEALRLLRVSVEWAKRRKCSSWRLTSENDDLTMLARRIGATETSPRFLMRL